jgi:hypothetical protein
VLNHLRDEPLAPPRPALAKSETFPARLPFALLEPVELLVLEGRVAVAGPGVQAEPGVP